MKHGCIPMRCGLFFFLLSTTKLHIISNFSSEPTALFRASLPTHHVNMLEDGFIYAFDENVFLYLSIASRYLLECTRLCFWMHHFIFDVQSHTNSCNSTNGCCCCCCSIRALNFNTSPTMIFFYKSSTK